ncbi:MAG: penicillin acylase family protein [Limnochordaceae bacterium]|nr:penicillin acylase family protein [Limnochordaceae bacterium]
MSRAWRRHGSTAGAVLLALLLGVTTPAPAQQPPASPIPAEAGAPVEAGAAAPAPEELRLPGLIGPVRVVEDTLGIPHVVARTEHDAAFAIGYLQARDRLFEMDVSRRRAEGTLAELLGSAALSEDVQMRTLGLSRAAARSLERLSPGARGELEAFAAGVNAYIDEAERAGALPAEYRALELTRVRRWQPVDSVSVLKLVGFGLSFSMDAQYATILQAYVRAMGPERGIQAVFYDLWPLAPAENAFVVPDAVGYAPASGSPLAGAISQDVQGRGVEEMLAGWLSQMAAVTAPWAGAGSNWFVIGPRLSASGYPLLANDPHLPLTHPPVWYQQHLTVQPDGAARPSLNVYGVAFPGVPWVILGHNERIAWGATTNPIDQTDMYLERLTQRDGQWYALYRGNWEPVRVLPQKFLVNAVGNGTPDDLQPAPAGQVPQAVLEVPRHGPIVRINPERQEALSVQWTGLYATHDGENFYRWNRASNLQEFREGLRYFDAASQNWAYADVEGNIAYFAGAELPLREDLEAGAVDGGPSFAPWLLRDGTGLRRHDWIAWPPGEALPGDQGIPFRVLPESEMPHVVNPAQGFIVSANNDPVGVTAGGDPLAWRRASGGIYYLGPAFSPGFRAARITERIRQRARQAGKLTVQDAMAIQSDVVELEAKRLLPFLLRAWERAGLGEKAVPQLAALRSSRMAEAIGYLQDWDGSTPTGLPEGWDGSPGVAVASHGPGQAVRPAHEPSVQEVRASVAATLFNVWVGQLIRATVDAAVTRVSPDLPLPDGTMAVKAILYQLEHFDRTRGKGVSGLQFFDVPDLALDPADERDLLLLSSLDRALGLLTGPVFEPAFGKVRDLSDLRWGKLHRLVLAHPLGGTFGIPPAGGFDAPEYAAGLPVDGGFEVVDASGFDPRATTPQAFRFSGGPSMRLVVEMRPGAVTAYNVIPGGQAAGAGAGPHFADLLPAWLSNQAYRIPFTQQEVEAAAERAWVMSPAGGQP